MARFPFGPSLVSQVYELDIPEGKTFDPAPLTRLWEYFEGQNADSPDACFNGRLFRSRVPPSLGFSQENLWGWCLLDNENPVSVGPWLVFGIRGWKKKVPPRLLTSIVEERTAAWCRENGRERPPKSVKLEIRDAAKLELLGAQLPEVGDVGICVDIVRRRLLLPGVSPVQGRGIVSRLQGLLRFVLHPELRIVEMDLEATLYRSRPSASFPSGIGERFLAFLTQQAKQEAWGVFRDVPEHDEPVVLQLSLDGDVSFRTDDEDTIRAQGDEAVKDALRWLDDDGERVRVSQSSIMLTEAEPGSRQFEIRIDDKGMIRKARCYGGYVVSDADLETAVFERCETMTEIHQIVRLLVHAFDAGPLSEIMATARQAQLWAGHVEPRVSWHDDLPSPAELGLTAPQLGDADARIKQRAAAYARGVAEVSGDERAARAYQRQAGDATTGLASIIQAAKTSRSDLLERGGITSVTFSAGGKSVTLTADAAARGAAAIAAMDAAESPPASMKIKAPCGARDPSTSAKCDGPVGHKKKHGAPDPENPGKRVTW